MRLIFFLVSLTLSFTGKAQYWVQNSEGNALSEATGIAIDQSGKTYICGYYTGNTTFGLFTLSGASTSDIFVASTDANGNYMWVETFGGTGTDRANDICVDASGNVYVTGFFNGSVNFGGTILVSSGSQDVFVIKLNSTGQLVWAKKFGGSQADLGVSVAFQNLQNKVVVFGQFKGTSTFGLNSLSSNNNSVDVFVCALNENDGSIYWIKQGESDADLIAIDMDLSANDEIYLAGSYSDTLIFSQTYNNAAQNAIYLLKIDSLGEDLWFKRLSGSIFNVLRDIDVAENQNVYLVGDFSGSLNISGYPFSLSGAETYKSFILNLSPIGSVVWTKKLHSENYLSARSISVGLNQKLWISGSFQCGFIQMQSFYDVGVFNSISEKDAFSLKLNQNGNIEYGQHFASQGSIETNVSEIFGNKLYSISSYTDEPIIPISNNFNLSQLNTFDSLVCDTNFNYCNDPNYGDFITLFQAGTSQFCFGPSIDTLRSTYDYFIRSGTSCFLGLPNLQIQSLGITCDSTSSQVGVNQIMCEELAPTYVFLDSFAFIGNDTTRVFRFLVPADSCLPSFADSADLMIVQNNLTLPLITDNQGFNNQESQPLSVELCGLTPTFLTTNNQLGATASWTYNGQNQVNDTAILATTTGSYVVVLTDTNGCSSSNSVDVIFYDSLPQFNFQLFIEDTVTFCENNIQATSFWVYDSISNPTAAMECIQEFFPGTTIEKYTIESVVNFTGVASQSSIVCGNIGQFWITQSGMTYFTVDVTYSNICDTITISFSDSVYTEIIPAPPADTFNFSILGPSVICPFDTVALIAQVDTFYSWFGENYINAGPDTILITQPGQYIISYYSTDTNLYGCSSTSFGYAELIVGQYSVPTIWSDKYYLCPGDSVNFNASTQLTNPSYQWQGPLGNFGTDTSYATATSPGVYYCIISNAECSIESNSITIESYSTPEISASGGNILCKDSFVIIEVNSNFIDSINWLTPLSGNASTQTISTPGIYQCAITACGIPTISSISISSSTNSLSILQNGAFCKDSFAVLSADNDFILFNWQPNFESSSEIVITDTGWYKLSAIDSNGCPFNDSIHIEIKQQNAGFNFSGNSQACSGDTISLFAHPNLDNLLWFPTLETSLSIQVYSDQTIALRASDSLGCISTSDSVSFQFNSTNIDLGFSDSITICEGDSLNISAALFQLSNLVWMPFGQNSSNITINTSGLYFLKAVDSNNCQVTSDSISVQLIDNPVLSALIPTRLCENETRTFLADSSLTLFAVNAFNGNILDSGDEISITTSSSISNIWIYAKDSDCFSDTTTVLLDSINCDLFIPNVITPNGDGLNDVFIPENIPTGCYLMNIFDRWGNLVFSTNSSKIGWDGTHLYSGNAATNGVYFYSIQYCIEEIVVLSGSFTLLR